MMGRRSAALLCVLLAHALMVAALLRMRPPAEPPAASAEPGELLHLPQATLTEPERALPRMPGAELPSVVAPELPEIAADESGDPVTAPITLPQGVDWPLEGRLAAKRVLDAEEEAERVAKMFSGPKGTWASLTPRDRSAVKKFRWKLSVVPERDEHGNTIMQISEGCVLVNFSFIGCALGKRPVHGDLFKDMRLYVDEQRRPESKNGNGR